MRLITFFGIAALWANSASAATITSGSLYPNGPFTFTLSDGFSFSGYDNPDFVFGRSQCFSYAPVCSLSTTYSAAPNGVSDGFTYNGRYSAQLRFSSDPIIPTDQRDGDVYAIPFTASGTVFGPYADSYIGQLQLGPCALPGNMAAYPAFSESVTGAGTLFATVAYQHLTPPSGPYDYYYIQAEQFVLSSAAPEPSTFLLLLAPAILLARRYYGGH